MSSHRFAVYRGFPSGLDLNRIAMDAVLEKGCAEKRKWREDCLQEIREIMKMEIKDNQGQSWIHRTVNHVLSCSSCELWSYFDMLQEVVRLYVCQSEPKRALCAPDMNGQTPLDLALKVSLKAAWDQNLTRQRALPFKVIEFLMFHCISLREKNATQAFARLIPDILKKDITLVKCVCHFYVFLGDLDGFQTLFQTVQGLPKKESVLVQLIQSCKRGDVTYENLLHFILTEGIPDILQKDGEALNRQLEISREMLKILLRALQAIPLNKVGKILSKKTFDSFLTIPDLLASQRTPELVKVFLKGIASLSENLMGELFTKQNGVGRKLFDLALSRGRIDIGTIVLNEVGQLPEKKIKNFFTSIDDLDDKRLYFIIDNGNVKILNVLMGMIPSMLKKINRAKDLSSDLK